MLTSRQLAAAWGWGGCAKGRISDTIRGPRPHRFSSIAWLCYLAATCAEIRGGNRLCLGGDIRRPLKSKRNLARGGCVPCAKVLVWCPFLSHLALIFGPLALSTVGQGAPLTVLNWIPPNSFNPPATLDSLNTAGLLVSGSKASGTIPMWLCLAATTPSAQCNTTYSFAMVGKNPTVTDQGRHD